MTTSSRAGYLELRPLPEQHLPTLLKVYQGTPLYFDGLGYDVQRLALADVRAQWSAAQTTPGARAGIYHSVTDLLIGAADVQRDAPHAGAASILLLLIWGGFQRQGVRPGLYGAARRLAARRGRTASSGALATNNEEGQSFLALQGFQPTGEPATPPIAAGDAFWMQRPSATR